MIEYDYKDGTNLSDSLDNLYTIITLLRSEEGCPWDRLQTNKSALESLIDESYEYLDGIIKENIESEREEIGDVMINVFMTLRIHEENGDFKPEDAVNEVCRKLIRRHPHVFGDKKVDSAEGVLTLWNEVKEKVEGKKDNEEDFFSHIPSSLPPLMEAYEIQKKMKKVGFDWENVDGVIDKVKEELIEVELAIKEGDKDKTEEEIGDLLFSVVNLSRFLKIRPNTALKRCDDKIKNRFQKLFDKAKKENIPLDRDHMEEMNMLWETIKKEEK